MRRTFKVSEMTGQDVMGSGREITQEEVGFGRMGFCCRVGVTVDSWERIESGVSRKFNSSELNLVITTC